MAVVARLLPRHWDGRRLLQFLTGLALIALAFATPVLAASPETPSPATVVTTVDAPLGPALVDRVVPPGPHAAPDAAGAADAAAPEHPAGLPAGEIPAVSTDAAGAAVLCRRDVPGLSGVAQRSYAGRAPPSA